ncbi:MAG TPA: hypothetical protein VE136_16920 [Anaerolineales bacterium]|nr:hypothetical protein [Anaerolineales bacterium]
MNGDEQVAEPLYRVQRTAWLVGLIASGFAIAGFFIGGSAQFFQSYLFAYLFWLGLTLGALAWSLLNLLVGGRWGMPVRRIMEAASKNVWVMALLFLPIIFGFRSLYPWARPDLVAEDPVLQHKSIYLNVPFVILRAVLYFVLWFALSRGISGWTEKAAKAADPEIKSRYQRFSAFGSIAYVLSMTFASVDWIMSIQPDWFSTVFGFLVISAQTLTALSFAIVITPVLARQKPLSEIMSPGIYRDLGALLFTNVMLWAYLAFSQYLIIWSGNLTEEITWFLDRSRGGWQWLGLLVILTQFALPFSVLLSLRAKRNARILASAAGIVLVIRLVDDFWEVIPTFRPDGFSLHWLDIIIALAMGGIWVAAFIWHLRSTPVLLAREAQDYGPTEPREIRMGAHE